MGNLGQVYQICLYEREGSSAMRVLKLSLGFLVSATVAAPVVAAPAGEVTNDLNKRQV